MSGTISTEIRCSIAFDCSLVMTMKLSDKNTGRAFHPARGID